MAEPDPLISPRDASPPEGKPGIDFILVPKSGQESEVEPVGEVLNSVSDSIAGVKGAKSEETYIPGAGLSRSHKRLSEEAKSIFSSSENQTSKSLSFAERMMEADIRQKDAKAAADRAKALEHIAKAVGQLEEQGFEVEIDLFFQQVFGAGFQGIVRRADNKD